MKRSWQVGARAALLLTLAASLLACSPTNSAITSPSGRANGYLYASPSEAIFVEWDGARGATAGKVDWRTAPSQRITAGFTVENTSGGFAFRFDPGSLAGWTGRLDGTSLTLVIPSSTGSLRTIAMRPASPDEFERAAAALR